MVSPAATFFERPASSGPLSSCQAVVAGAGLPSSASKYITAKTSAAAATLIDPFSEHPRCTS
jgi:hypothetical protein